MIALLLLACGPRLTDAPDAPPVSLEARLESRQVASGRPAELEISVETDAGWSFAAPVPEVQGLTVEQQEPDESGTDSRLVTRFHYQLSGPDGSYIVPPLAVNFAGPAGESQSLSTAPLYLDVGVKGPTSDIDELAAVPEERDPMRVYELMGLAAGAAVGFGLMRWLLRRPKPVVVEPPPDPAEVALAAWARAWADPGLDEHGLARELSAIFRRYLEQALEVEAESRTSFEVMDLLREHPRFTASLHQRAGRLLSATDLVKFARQGDRELFVTLDEDLREVVAATRAAREPANV